jgi:putative membrane protein
MIFTGTVAVRMARGNKFKASKRKNVFYGRWHISGWLRLRLKNLKIKIMKPINYKIILALGVSGLAATAAFADDMNTNTLPTTLTSQQFVSDAAVGGLKEVYLSQLALVTSTNTDVQTFAKRMVKDHRAANAKLAKLADAEGLSFPATNTFSAEDSTWSNPLIANPESIKGGQMLISTNLPYRSDYLAVQNVKSLTGVAFDQAYVSDMVSDHAATVSEFETASQSLSDAKLKKFADKTLPTLRHHSMMAQELNDQLNSPAGTSVTNQPSPNTLPTRPPIAPIP